MSKFGGGDGSDNERGRLNGTKVNGRSGQPASPNGFRLDSTQSSWLMDRLNALNEEDKISMVGHAAVSPRSISHDSEAKNGFLHSDKNQKNGSRNNGSNVRHLYDPTNVYENQNHQNSENGMQEEQPLETDMVILPPEILGDMAEHGYSAQISEGHSGHGAVVSNGRIDHKNDDFRHEEYLMAEGDDEFGKFGGGPNGDPNAVQLKEKIDSLEQQLAQISPVKTGRVEETLPNGHDVGQGQYGATGRDENFQQSANYQDPQNQLPPGQYHQPQNIQGQFTQGQLPQGQHPQTQQQGQHGQGFAPQGGEFVEDPRYRENLIEEDGFDEVRLEMEAQARQVEAREIAFRNAQEREQREAQAAYLEQQRRATEGYEHSADVVDDGYDHQAVHLPYQGDGVPVQQVPEYNYQHEGESEESMAHGAVQLAPTHAYFDAEQNQAQAELPQFLAPEDDGKSKRSFSMSMLGGLIAILIIGGVGYSFLGKGVSDIVKGKVSDFAAKQSEKLSDTSEIVKVDKPAAVVQKQEKVVEVASVVPTLELMTKQYKVDTLIGVSGNDVPFVVTLPDLKEYPSAFVVVRELPSWIVMNKGRLVKGSWIISAPDVEGMMVNIPKGKHGSFAFEVDLVYTADAKPIVHAVNAVISAKKQKPSEADIAGIGLGTRTPNLLDEKGILKIDKELEKKWIERGTKLLMSGDITTARLTFSHLAEQGSGRGALAMGKTYDPTHPNSKVSADIVPNHDRALFWYRRALALGSEQARVHLQALAAKKLAE